MDYRVGKRGNHVSRDAFPQGCRHVACAKNADESVECQVRIALLRDGQYTCQQRGRLAVGDRDYLDVAGQGLRLHDRVCRPVKVDSSFSRVSKRLDRVTVWHPLYVKPGLFDMRSKDQIGGTGD